MRISSRQIVDNVLVNLQRNYARLDRLQNHLSAGKEVIFPSDNPASATTAMRLHSAVLENQQYLKNAQSAVGWLEATDSALQDMAATLHRARELTIQGARGDLPDDDREALAREMDQLLRHAVQVANTTHGGRYVFGGTATQATPYAISGTDADGYVTEVSFSGNPDPFSYEVGAGVTQEVNISGASAFGHDGIPGPITTGLFATLSRIRGDLSTGNVAQLSGQDLTDLDNALDDVLQALDRVGARQAGFELIVQRLQGQEVNLRDLLSKAEDLDVPRAIMELKMQENVYRLALASGARIIQPTLLDFLR
ncbi:MAG: flagellar hook-associated protein FlgL [Bacillota bacterium]